MKDFLQKILDTARSNAEESVRKKTASDADLLKRWREFSAQYNDVGLSLRQLNGVRTCEYKPHNGPIVYGTLRLDGFVDLPAEPAMDDDVFMLRLFIDIPEHPKLRLHHIPSLPSFVKPYMFDGWIINWIRWPELRDATDKRHRYADGAHCWMSLRDDNRYSTMSLLDVVCRRLVVRIDSEHYNAADNRRALDL